MKNRLLLFIFPFMVLSIWQCGGGGNPATPPPPILIINTPNPAPTLLAVDHEDLTPQMGQPTIMVPASSHGMTLGRCILALYGSTGMYNVGRHAPVFFGGGTNVPNPPPVTVTYSVDPANTRPIPLSYNNGTTMSALSIQSSSLLGRHMEISYLGNTVNSWQNEPQVGPFANQPIPPAKVDVMFTVKDNLQGGNKIFHPASVTVNVSSGNHIVVAMQPNALFCDSATINSILRRSEVHIAHQNFGKLQISPYEPVPDALVSVASNGELQATIPLPQATMSAFRGANGRPMPGFYYIRLRLYDGNNVNMVAEISPAFVVWGF